jgi:hypothetical protein
MQSRHVVPLEILDQHGRLDDVVPTSPVVVQDSIQVRQGCPNLQLKVVFTDEVAFHVLRQLS